MPSLVLLTIARGGSGGVAFDSLFGFYNGRVGAGNPQQLLGITSSNGGRQFTSEVGATFQVSGAGGWYDTHIAQACLVQEGAEWAAYLSGYDGSNWRIGRWYSAVLDADPDHWFVDNGGDPIIDLGGPGDPDENGANFPQVEYDAATGLRRIWYTGWNASNVTTICYAELDASDVLTKYGRVLNVGAGGTFEDAGLETGPTITIGGQKRIYYDGYDGAEWTQAYATYTDPRSAATYSKQGALPSLTGPLSVPEGAYGSVHLHSLLPRVTGGYIGMVTLFHPVGSANQREISCFAASHDGLTFSAPSGPIVPMSTTYPATESRENPAVLVT